jgi:hypothetical protein
MRRAIFLCAVVAAVVLLPSSAASGRQKQYVLTALADIGTVYWRYDCVHYKAPEWSLGIRIYPISATTGIIYRAGRFGRRRTGQPGYPTIWFPFRRERKQSLSVVQGTEAGELRGHVLANFGHGGCQSYFPPRLTVELYPR